MQPCPPHLTPSPRRLALLSLCLAAGLLACAAVLLAVAPPVWAAPAAVERPYPGAAPCDTSLQACIDGAVAGDTIIIQAGTYITSFTLNKTISLISADQLREGGVTIEEVDHVVLEAVPEGDCQEGGAGGPHPGSVSYHVAPRQGD